MARVFGVPRRAVAAAALCLLSAAAGCSGPEKVDVSGFSPGACRAAAASVQDVDATLTALRDKDLSPKVAGNRLKLSQDVLLAARNDADPVVAEAITNLVTALGFLRISVDSNNYDGSQVGDARIPLEALVKACTPGPQG